ncbi:DEAD/DEAH box helicase [Tsuneonella sp. HG222]
MGSEILSAPAELFLRAVEPKVIERVEIPPRPARYARPPAEFTSGATGDWLAASVGSSDKVFANQAAGLEKVVAGANLVISTPTASGKSLVFMAAAIDELLNRGGRVLVFYPQKALGSDQFTRWQKELELAGLDPNLVGEITGAIPMGDREQILDRSRVILATPDALHCWMMRMLPLPAVQSFLGALRYIVIDEAHALEGVFGTQFAYFFRRLRDARCRAAPNSPEPQVIAATATLRDPADHLQNLTGLPFEVVGEEENGAPSHGVTLLHINGPDCGAPAERAGAEIMDTLLDAMPSDAGAIAFADSRQGTERMAKRVGREDVFAYRGGYNPNDRRRLERGLRNGSIKAIFSTSASELGIDIPQFTFGLNIGVPQTRKSLRQRGGRVGRTRPGLFAVMAPTAAFAKLGSSLRESLSGPVEHSPLYLENRYIQFQQARCYLRELGCEDEVPALDPAIGWPDGFREALETAMPGAERPRMLDEIASAGWDTPHLAYLLRSMPTISFALKNARSGDVIGTIDHEKALREAYPGATYIHLGVHYRVLEWHNWSYEQSIRLLPVKSAEPTQPLSRFQVGASLAPAELIDDHLLASDDGCLAEAQLRVVESVEGYRLGTTALLYRDLREKDRRLQRKQREFTTTGVILRIEAPWFAGSSESQVATRREVARALEEIVTREYGLSPSDIRAVHTGIALHTQAGARKIDDAIALFDTISGGLRLAAPLFGDFAAILARLERGAQLAGEEALLSPTTIARLSAWHAGLIPSAPPAPTPVEHDGKHVVFAPSSRVSIRVRGQVLERVLIEPQLLSIGDSEQLMYRYEDAPGVTAWVAHNQVEPLGNDWRRALWDPATNLIQPWETNA